MAAVGVEVSAEVAVTAGQGSLPGEGVMLSIKKGDQGVQWGKALSQRGALLPLRQGSAVRRLIKRAQERGALLPLEPEWRRSKMGITATALRRLAEAL